jgi:hypothetical protein
MKARNFLKHHPGKPSRWSRGQGLIETAMLLPVLFVVLSGLMEFGFMLNEYLALQDAVRNAARFASDGDYNSADTIYSCTATKDFYRQTACLVNQELTQERPTIIMNNNGTPSDFNNDYIEPTGTQKDDIVISVFAMKQKVGVVQRYPVTADSKLGWSYAADLLAAGKSSPGRNAESAFTTTDITNMWLNIDKRRSTQEISMGNTTPIATPSTGLLLVELVYHYNQKLKLPWITVAVPDPVTMRFHAIMPLVSAEPK